MCTALVCRAQYSMPVRLGHWQSQTSSICSRMIGQWSDRSVMSGCKTLSPPGPMSYLHGLALRIWTSFWRKEGSGAQCSNAPMLQSRQPFTYRLMESMGLGGPKWHGSSWQRRIAESGSSWLSTLMIDIPGDLMWDLPCMQQASYCEGGPLMWMLPLYSHVNQKSDYDDDYEISIWSGSAKNGGKATKCLPLFRMGWMCRTRNSKWQKLSSLEKLESLPSVSSTLYIESKCITLLFFIIHPSPPTANCVCGGINCFHIVHPSVCLFVICLSTMFWLLLVGISYKHYLLICLVFVSL